MRFYFLFIALLVNVNILQAYTLKENYPERYIVQPGDTLWGIADKFLSKPWEWESLWHSNPNLKDPSKLYPGMILNITSVNGKKMLRLSRGGTMKLSPKVKHTSVPDPIPTIALGRIAPFLHPSTVFENDKMDDVPHVIDFADEHLLGGPNFILYSSELHEGQAGDKFNIFRPTEDYFDKDDRKSLGSAAEYIGHATLLHTGSPASFKINRAISEVHVGDRLVKDKPHNFPLYFIPRAPEKKMEGRIISLHGEVLQLGRNQVVVINRGREQGVLPGYVFAVYEPKRKKEDPIESRVIFDIPEERVGEVMVFRVFPKVSMALVMHSSEPLRKYFKIYNP